MTNQKLIKTISQIFDNKLNKQLSVFRQGTDERFNKQDEFLRQFYKEFQETNKRIDEQDKLFKQFHQETNKRIDEQDKLFKRLPDLIRDIMREELDKSVKRQIKEYFGKFPTKDEFYKMMDELMGELKTAREEQTILGHRVYGHEERVEKLEEIHPKYKHIHPN